MRVYLKELLDSDTLELHFQDRSGAKDRELLIPYMMNDAVEYVLWLSACSMQGRWEPTVPLLPEAEFAVNGGRNGILLRQEDGSSLSIWYGDAVLESHNYQYHRIGHNWRREKGGEALRRLVNLLCVLHDKYTFLGAAACNEQEIRLASLIEFGPLCYWTPINEPLTDWYPETMCGIEAMTGLVREAGDVSYLELLREYRKLAVEISGDPEGSRSWMGNKGSDGISEGTEGVRFGAENNGSDRIPEGTEGVGFVAENKRLDRIPEGMEGVGFVAENKGSDGISEGTEGVRFGVENKGSDRILDATHRRRIAGGIRMPGNIARAKRKKETLFQQLAQALEQEDHRGIFCLLQQKIEAASLSWEERKYSPEEEAAQERQRRQSEARYYQMGYQGSYPQMWRCNPTTGRKEEVFFAEEHPFTVLESEEYRFRIWPVPQ